MARSSDRRAAAWLTTFWLGLVCLPACGGEPASLSVTRVSPTRVSSQHTTELTVEGAGFVLAIETRASDPSAAIVRGFTATLEQEHRVTNARVTRIPSPQRLVARVPAGLLVGAYDLTVRGPNDTAATLLDAFTVSDPECTNDAECTTHACNTAAQCVAGFCVAHATDCEPCTNGTETSCAPGCTCALSCDTDCALTCPSATSCALTQAGSRNATLTCAGSCTQTCSGGATCTLLCTPGAQCQQACSGNSTCSLQCDEGAACEQVCDGAATCQMSCVAPVACGHGRSLCNQACP